MREGTVSICFLSCSRHDEPEPDFEKLVSGTRKPTNGPVDYNFTETKYAKWIAQLLDNYSVEWSGQCKKICPQTFDQPMTYVP